MPLPEAVAVHKEDFTKVVVVWNPRVIWTYLTVSVIYLHNFRLSPSLSTFIPFTPTCHAPTTYLRPYFPHSILQA